MTKRKYYSVELARVEVSFDTGILAGSPIDNLTIQAAGQQDGSSYDFGTGTGAEDGKFFNHEWN